MFTSDDINQIIIASPKGYDAVLIEEMGIKPTCPDCGGDCEKNDTNYKCQLCKTLVYQPDWVEDNLEAHAYTV